MTQEEKARAYDEVRKKIAIRFGSNVADEIFSQFEMSEDERIRKGLIGYFRAGKCENISSYHGIPTNDILSWLERQGEQKTVELKPFEIEHGKYYYCIQDYYSGGNKRASKGDVVRALRGMSMMALGDKANRYFLPINSIEQEPTWSEEDEYTLGETIQHLEELIRIDKAKHCSVDVQYYQRDIDWLKSLKNRMQPKQEWGREDEQFLLVCKNALAKYQVSDKWDARIISRWLENRLKPLCPQSPNTGETH